jgi:protein-S-isoprenylcysteine O-methyltransferase
MATSTSNAASGLHHRQNGNHNPGSSVPPEYELQEGEDLTAANTFTADPVGQVNRGGIGYSPGYRELRKPTADTEMEDYAKQYYPGQPISLSGIATRAWALGLVFAYAHTAAVYLAYVGSPAWRLVFFLGALSLFHYLEFWTTARYNTASAQTSSFLLTGNGSAYQIAHSAAFVECATRLFLQYKGVNMSVVNPLTYLPYKVPLFELTAFGATWLALGLFLVTFGQLIRSTAMIQAGSNFNHIVQYRRSPTHRLVTHGIYSILRHPSYFGFFWWGLGTQMVLGNWVCFVAYARVLWVFFARRIEGEETFLVGFFGDEYVRYRERTRVGIPFIR